LSLEKIVKTIEKNKYFLITSHINLEGDALGAELALKILLEKKKKKVLIINQDKTPQEYLFLPGVEKIKNKIVPFRFEVAIIVDCSDLCRCAEVGKLFTNKIVINIDHHISNSYFGDLNWVEPHASSASEMVYRLYKKMRINFNKEAAECLYTGILTDTGSFRYTNTTFYTHKIVAELLRYQILPSQIYKHIYQSCSFEDILLLTKVLPNLKRAFGGKVVWYALPKHIVRKWKSSFDIAEHLLNFARQIKGVEVVILFKENLGLKRQVRINFRSQGACDVNRIALYFGGGGHCTASACTLDGTLEQVIQKVLRKTKEFLK